MCQQQWDRSRRRCAATLRRSTSSDWRTSSQHLNKVVKLPVLWASSDDGHVKGVVVPLYRKPHPGACRADADPADMCHTFVDHAQAI